MREHFFIVIKSFGAVDSSFFWVHSLPIMVDNVLCLRKGNDL